MNANQNTHTTILRALAIATPEGFRPAIESETSAAKAIEVLEGLYIDREAASTRARIATLAIEMDMLEAFCA